MYMCYRSIVLPVFPVVLIPYITHINFPGQESFSVYYAKKIPFQRIYI